MPQDNDSIRNPEYFAARAVEERRLAMAAADPKVRSIHLEMASKYAALAAGEESAPATQAGDEQQRAV